MWVLPDEDGITPGYEQLEIDDELLRGGLVPVASGMAKHDGASGDPDQEQVRRAVRRPARSAARRSSCRRHRYLHLFVARGTVTLEGVGRARRGRRRAVHRDAAASGSPRREPAEILVWEMHATVSSS